MSENTVNQNGTNLPATNSPTTSSPSDVNHEVQQERFIFTPPIDIFENEEGLVLYADLPGVSLETLELQVQDNKLTLFGRVQTKIPQNTKPIHQEYHEGDYLRSFILSEEVNHDQITAKLTNGVLRVFLPKAPKSEPRKIEINVE